MDKKTEKMLDLMNKQKKREITAEVISIAVGAISGFATEAVMTEVIFDQFKGDFKDFSAIKKVGMCAGTLAISSTVAGLVWDYVYKNTKETVIGIDEWIFKDEVIADVIDDMLNEEETTNGRLPEEESCND